MARSKIEAMGWPGLYDRCTDYCDPQGLKDPMVGRAAERGCETYEGLEGTVLLQALLSEGFDVIWYDWAYTSWKLGAW
jgi:hypothetical protein